MSSNLVTAVAVELGVLVDPLRAVVVDPRPPHELMRLLRDAGWHLPGLGAADLTGLTTALEDLLDEVTALPATVRTDSLLELVDALTAVAETITSVRSLTEPFVDLLDELLDASPALATDLLEDLWQVLVLRWLSRRRPTLLRALRALDLVTIHEPTPLRTDDDVEVRAGSRLLRLDPARVLDLLDDPVALLRERYVPPSLGASVDAQVLALALGAGLRPLAAGLGGDLVVAAPWGILPELPADEQDMAGRSIALDLPVPSPDQAPWLPTLSLVAELLSAADTGALGRPGPAVELSLQGATELHAIRGPVEVDIDLDAVAGVTYLSPDEVVTAAGGAVAAAVSVTSTTPPVVIGGDRGSRLELGRPLLRAALLDGGEPDVEVELSSLGTRLVVSFGDGDSFLAGVLPGVEVDLELDLGLVWSRTGGLRLAGSPTLTATLRLDETVLGILTVELVSSSLVVTADGLDIVLVVDASLTIGPFEARVEGVGLRFVVTVTGDGNLGIANLTVEFHPPLGVDFEILVADTVVGGGFVRHDPATGRYTGALALEFLSIELGAIAVIDTRMPDDPDGWALFASLFLTFPQVPLGFGFFLSGVGGIVALHRTMDSLAIAAGLREGAIDTILFPDDALEQADEIIAGLDAWFPLAPGSTAFGLAAQITWGTPETIITGELGIVLALPDVEIAVLGSMELLLPPDEPLLELHLDTLGSYSATDRTVLVVASLYDSTLLGTIDLSGDMALYSRFGDQPYFLFSVGGYHPDFKPPGAMPQALRDLRRLRAEVTVSDDVWYALETYVAVTSNTFQFGALASFEASARFLGVTYTASGYVGFDVLLHFSPFSFTASFFAGAAVTSGENEREIVAIELEATLNGPQPWSATGYARFKFLGLWVRFEVAVGGAAGIEARARTNVLDEVLAALAEAASWLGDEPPLSPVTLVEDPEPSDGEAAVLRVRPDADLEVRQTIAPLNRPMEVYGLDDIDGPSELVVGASGITGLPATTSDPVVDWFAPAQYDELGQAARLAADSYEEMDAGVRIGAGGVATGVGPVAITPDYEVRLVSEIEQPGRRLGVRPAFADRLAADAGALVDATRATATRTASIPEVFVHTAATWTLADARTGESVGRPGTYKDRFDRLAARQDGDLLLVRTHATTDAAVRS